MYLLHMLLGIKLCLNANILIATQSYQGWGDDPQKRKNKES